MSDCPCHEPAFDYRDFAVERVGTDSAGGRFGEVEVLTCRWCETRWLLYRLEVEGFSGSGRWFRGLLGEGRVSAAEALAYLEGLPWTFVGGGYFASAGRKHRGKLPTDP